MCCRVRPTGRRSKRNTPRRRLSPGEALRLLKSPLFVTFLLAAGLIHGSHGMFYTFGVLHWNSLGIPPNGSERSGASPSPARCCCSPIPAPLSAASAQYRYWSSGRRAAIGALDSHELRSAAGAAVLNPVPARLHLWRGAPSAPCTSSRALFLIMRPEPPRPFVPRSPLASSSDA